MTFPSQLPSNLRIVSAALIVFSLLSGVYALTVDTPSDTSECETTKFTWQSAQSPFTLHILFAQNNSLVQQFADVPASSVSWQAAVPAGSVLYFEVFDSDPADNSVSFSGNFTILAGDDTCLQLSDTAVTTTLSHTSMAGSSSTSSSSTAQWSFAVTPPPNPPDINSDVGSINIFDSVS